MIRAMSFSTRGKEACIYIWVAKSIYCQAKEPNLRNNLIKPVIYSLSMI